MYVYRDYPEFSWSNSRHKSFLECVRKYYHQYYEAHNGWEYEAPEENKSAYRLKNIKNIPLLLGDEIHKVIDRQLKHFLNGKRLFTEDEMIALVTQKLNKAYLDSTKFRQHWFHKPKRYQMLHEIYYGDGLSPDVIASAKTKLRLCVSHFFRSKTYQDILTKLEMHVLHSEDFQTFEINGVDVFVVLDFVYKDVHQEKWIVVDWKTGKESEEDRKQLAFYALFLSQQHNIPIEDIILRNEYLLTGKSLEYKLTQFEINAAGQLMNDSIYHMLGYLENPARNKPLSIDQFQMNTSNKCQRCNFKEKCGV
ncbi:PD-(D/E)XK nuclease family protein [Neobacillus cucumis]|uniref:PD-(D/E)XK nuclease family protein n=1 Tax=Neobacillus cucumis TaxID=1740721 RepID=UPI0028531BB0|nr:PD-(D/E)XK nuclease family protein [Neobacillus cucumis]MDR4945406.1 PD-(D/E)XK nuclease family protein [Neobacillus cucumis]